MSRIKEHLNPPKSSSKSWICTFACFTPEDGLLSVTETITDDATVMLPLSIDREGAENFKWPTMSLRRDKVTGSKASWWLHLSTWNAWLIIHHWLPSLDQCQCHKPYLSSLLSWTLALCSAQITSRRCYILIGVLHVLWPMAPSQSCYGGDSLRGIFARPRIQLASYWPLQNICSCIAINEWFLQSAGYLSIGRTQLLVVLMCFCVPQIFVHSS